MTIMAGMEGFVPLPHTGKDVPGEFGDKSLYQVVRYKGIFDINELYRVINDWLVSKGYQVHESKYKSIALQTGGKEKTFDWNAHRKMTEFIMIWIDLHFQFQDIMEVEVVKNGKTVKLQKGLIMVRIQHRLEYDFSERMGRTKMGNVIVKFMTQIMWKKKIDSLWEDKLRFKCYELMNVIKETLDFMTKGNEHYDVW
jgi:hypothetical protein